MIRAELDCGHFRFFPSHGGVRKGDLIICADCLRSGRDRNERKIVKTKRCARSGEAIGRQNEEEEDDEW